MKTHYRGMLTNKKMNFPMREIVLGILLTLGLV